MNVQVALGILHTLEKLRQHECWTRSQVDAHQSEGL